MRMSSLTSGSAIDEILGDRAALESHFGIHLDSDESDLEVPSDDEWTNEGHGALLQEMWETDSADRELVNFKEDQQRNCEYTEVIQGSFYKLLGWMSKILGIVWLV